MNNSQSSILNRWIGRIVLPAVLLCFAAVLAPSLAKPVIFWTSDPVDPDQAVLVTGSDLKDVRSITVSRLPDTEQNIGKLGESDKATAQPIQAVSQSIKFIVPASLRPGVYSFDLIGDHGTVSGYLNKPSIYWIQGDQGNSGTPGGWIRVLGRNIGRSSATLLELSQPGLPPLRISAASHSLWDASFNIPSDIKVGSYNAKLWNGQGDRSSWEDAGKFAIAPAQTRSARVISAKSFGALGDGLHDDTAAVKAALASLKAQGGGTLQFPRGRYLLSDEIDIPSHINLEGEARNLVSLNWPEFKKAPPALLSGFSDFTVKHLTIFASNYVSVLSGGFSSDKDGIRKGANITIQDVMIRASAYRGHITPDEGLTRYKADLATQSVNGPASLKLAGENVNVVDSDVYGSGSAFLFLEIKDGYIARNKFYDGRGWHSITGADRLIFENNEVTGADLQSAGGGMNTLSKTVSFSQNILFSHNMFSSMHGWDGYVMTSDGPGGYYYGPVKLLASNRLILPGPLSDLASAGYPWAGAGLFVVGGSGAGEFATVKQFAGNIVMMDSDLPVAPDATSVIAVVQMQKNYLLIGNDFSDVSLAIQLYGTSVNSVIAQNTSQRTGGFVDFGLVYHQFQPSWYNQILDNKVLEGNLYDIGGGHVVPGGAVIGVFGQAASVDPLPTTRGIIVRGNILLNNAEIDVKGLGPSKAASVVDVVVENNKIRSSEAGIVANSGTQNVFVGKNSFEDVGQDVLDSSVTGPN